MASSSAKCIQRFRRRWNRGSGANTTKVLSKALLCSTKPLTFGRQMRALSPESATKRNVSVRRLDPAKIPGLKAAFRANGTITPAASSANADGAAALILAKRSLADRDGLPVLAEIKGHATHSQKPQWLTTAPIPAIRKLLDKVGWSVGNVDLFEINEAFAVVAMAAQKGLGIPGRS
jgi:acetyl-CoA acetyltransferase